jgi:hypothetical protein
MASISDLKELLRRETLAVVIVALVIGLSLGGWFYKSLYEYHKEEAAIAKEQLRKAADDATTLRKRIAELEKVERPSLPKSDRPGIASPLVPTSQNNDRQDQVRPDAMKFIVSELMLPASALPSGSISMSQDDHARAAFSIENRSGVDVEIAVQESGYSFGPCFPGPHPPLMFRGMPTAGIKGLPVISASEIDRLRKEQNPSGRLRRLPNGDKIAGAITFWPGDCAASMFPNTDATTGSITVVVATGKDVSVLSLNTDNVPIRVLRK